MENNYYPIGQKFLFHCNDGQEIYVLSRVNYDSVGLICVESGLSFENNELIKIKRYETKVRKHDVHRYMSHIQNLFTPIDIDITLKPNEEEVFERRYPIGTVFSYRDSWNNRSEYLILVGDYESGLASLLCTTDWSLWDEFSMPIQNGCVLERELCEAVGGHRDRFSDISIDAIGGYEALFKRE
jgi:hypothetical protein